MIDPEVDAHFHDSLESGGRPSSRTGCTGYQRFYRTLVEECNTALLGLYGDPLFAPLAADRFELLFAYADGCVEEDACAASNLRLAPYARPSRSFQSNRQLVRGGAQFTEHAGRMSYGIHSIAIDQLLPRAGSFRLYVTADQAVVFILHVLLDAYAERARWLAKHRPTDDLRFDLGLMNCIFELPYSQSMPPFFQVEPIAVQMKEYFLMILPRSLARSPCSPLYSMQQFR